MHEPLTKTIQNVELRSKSTVNTKMKSIVDLFTPVKNINTSLSEGPTTSNKSDNISNDNRKLKTYRSYIYIYIGLVQLKPCLHK